jgi:hypothetical protein
MKKLDLLKVLEFENLAGKFFARTCVLRGEYWRGEVDTNSTLSRHRNHHMQKYEHI